MNGSVHTVLGPVPADRLGVVAVHEALLSVLPGAQFAFDIDIDRAEIFEDLEARLIEFREAGGGTVVDSTGMFYGRDVRLYEALSRSTGVRIVASTGLGPEELLGGYFLTPQTNPPTPWPAEKFAELFANEVTEGMVVPRVERRGSGGLVVTCVTRGGATATDQSLLRGAARAALTTGVALSLRYGDDAAAELETVLAEGLAADRVVVGGVDRFADSAIALAAAGRGAFVAIDSIGHEQPSGDGAAVTDRDRVSLVVDLIAAGHADRVLLSSNSVGVAKGHPEAEVPLSHVLTAFVPLLKSHGVDEGTIGQLLVGNPRDLLSVR